MHQTDAAQPVNRRRLFGALAVVILVALASVFHFRRDEQKPPFSPLPAPTRIFDEPHAAAGLVDDAVCSECHGEIATAYADSGMAQSWSTWMDAKAVEVREATRIPVVHAGPLHYDVTFPNARLLQTEWVGTDAEKQVTKAVFADYVLGSGTKGRSYLSSANGFLQILPVSWYTQGRQWDMAPQYDVDNRRFSRPIDPHCASCHNSRMPLYPGSHHRYKEPLPRGIGCQRCHGPGQEHVAYWNDEQSRRSTSDPITSIAGLDSKRRQDVCLQCHLTSNLVVKPPESTDHYLIPGDNLHAIRYDFFFEQNKTKFRLTGHGPRSMASACYQKSDGAMTCILCHDPHRSLANTPLASYNQRCIDCHQTMTCSRQLRVEEKAQSGNCIGCHMPKQAADTIPHSASTEHWIRRPGDTSPLPAARTRHGLSTLDNDVPDVVWGAALVDAYARFGSSRPPGLLEGVRLLAQHKDGGWEYDLARGLFALGETHRALALLEESVRANPDHFRSRWLYAKVLDRLGMFQQAVDAYETLRRQWPWHVQSDAEVASLLLKLGRYEQVLRMSTDRRAGPADAYFLECAARASEKSRTSDAELAKLMDAVVNADGLNADMHRARAELARRIGDKELYERSIHAVEVLTEALQSGSNNNTPQNSWKE